MTVLSPEIMIDWRSKASAIGALAWLTVEAPRQPRFPFRQHDAIERAQRRRVAATISYAYRHVPYYRETMRRLGLVPADIRTAADLRRLPVIERADLQADPERFTSRVPAASRAMSRLSARTRPIGWP
jgi:phenylacetate-coenzyme A ligase PaaK-like adenylate-forming protein